MTKVLLLAGTMLLAIAATAFADEPQTSNEKEKHATTKATFLITGLHCPPCTRTVESSLSRIKGVRSIHVDWKTKNARIEFDESILPAQKVDQLIATTPHMMSRSMHYGGWLALKVPELKDDASAEKAKSALSKVEGVKQVAVYPARHSVSVAFAGNGKLTSAQLIDALNKAGIKAENL